MITPIRETQIHASFCRLYYKLKHQSIPILEQMLTSLQLIRNRRMLWSPDIVALNKRISDIPLYYSEYFADKEERRKLFEKLKYDIETIIKDFLNSIGSDKLYMDTPPELEGLSNRK